MNTNPRGFTLPELLAVLGIIVLLLGMTVPGFRGFGDSMRLATQAGELVDQLVLARQRAVSGRQYTEVRWLRLPTDEGQPQKWAMQTWIYNPLDGTARPERGFRRLHEMLTFNRTLSPLLEDLPGKTTTLPGVTGDCTYQSIRFRPDGRVAETLGNRNYFTLQSVTESATAPLDYVTLQINPLTGQITSYRP